MFPTVREEPYLTQFLRVGKLSLALSERMLAFSSRKEQNKHGGGSGQQPLPYLDPTYSSPNANAGSNLLKQDGLILRPVIPRMAGGSVQQPLPYLDPTFSSPSAPTNAGSDLLKQHGLILRPRIGGFLPSVMKGVVNSAFITAPLSVMAMRRMMNKTRKNGGGKKENWARNREAAKEELSKYGKPSGLNVNKYAALLRKNEAGAEDWLTSYILKKRQTAKKTPKKNKKANKTVKNKTNKKNKKEVKTASLWKNLVDRAKKDLQPYGKPSGANLHKFASLKQKQLNTTAFLANYQTRKKYVAPVAVKTARNTYKNNLQKAKQELATLGKPTAPNLAKYVSLKRKGQSVKPVENAVKSRVKPVEQPVGLAVKPTTRSPPPPKQDMEKIMRNLQLLHKKIKVQK
jgi:hypothetical protein